MRCSEHAPPFRTLLPTTFAPCRLSAVPAPAAHVAELEVVRPLDTMSAEEHPKDWKLKLLYGNLTTPFRHYTVIDEVVVGELSEGFSCPPGSAFMAMKTWVSSTDESANMAAVIGRQIGFTVTGDIQIYDTEPVEPPRERPFAYDIQFTPFDENAA